jgi:hypothetical protein
MYALLYVTVLQVRMSDLQHVSTPVAPMRNQNRWVHLREGIVWTFVLKFESYFEVSHTKRLT